VLRAATIARRFVYDPNFRPRLTAPSQALALLRQLAPLAEVITPSWPEETRQLLDLPADAAAEDAIGAVTDLGSPGVVMTCGPEGALVVTGGRVHRIPGVQAPEVVDQTGAGDCLTGTLAARLSAGDSLLEAARLATAAASLSVQGRGGTGFVPTLQESRRAMAEAWPAKESTH
jgi:2-dehydro-3-deoxygluconokinase